MLKHIKAHWITVKGFSYLEMLVVTSLLVLVGVAMTSLVGSYTKTSTIAQREIALQQKTRDALHWLAKTLSQTGVHSIGNLVHNGGFELEPTDPNAPLYWSSDSNMKYFRFSGANTIVRSGRGAIQLTSRRSFPPTTYESPRTLAAPHYMNIKLKAGCVYYVSAWVRTASGDSGVYGRLQLVEEGTGTVLTSLQPAGPFANNLQWNRIRFRYPPAGTMGSDVYAYIRLSVGAPTTTETATVVIDDVSVVSSSILASPYLNEASIVLGNDPSDTHSGFFAESWVTGTSVVPRLGFFRYLVNANKQLIREEITGFGGGTWTIDTQQTKIVAEDVARVAVEFFDPDANQDGVVNGADQTLINSEIGKREEEDKPSNPWNPLCDLDKNGVIESADTALVSPSNSDTIWLTLECRKSPREIGFKDPQAKIGARARVSKQVYLANP